MNVQRIKGIDVEAIEAEARKEIAEELTKKAKLALTQKLRALEAARQVVRNIEFDIDDLKASIADGSFVG